MNKFDKKRLKKLEMRLSFYIGRFSQDNDKLLQAIRDTQNEINLIKNKGGKLC